MPKKVPVIPAPELRHLHTGSLLTRLRDLLACEDYFGGSDRYDDEPKPDPDETGILEFKDTEAWRKAYKDVKDILATREHLPTGSERREKCLRRAAANFCQEKIRIGARSRRSKAYKQAE